MWQQEARLLTTHHGSVLWGRRGFCKTSLAAVFLLCELMPTYLLSSSCVNTDVQRSGVSLREGQATGYQVPGAVGRRRAAEGTLGTGCRMTVAARLEDIEVTLEHMLMDVFVSASFSSSKTTDDAWILTVPTTLETLLPTKYEV